MEVYKKLLMNYDLSDYKIVNIHRFLRVNKKVLGKFINDGIGEFWKNLLD